jgi:hypothetical protein
MLYYEDANRHRTEVGNASTIEEALKQIGEYLKERNFQLCYIRYWMKRDGETVFDFGSHVEFFILKDE